MNKNDYLRKLEERVRGHLAPGGLDKPYRVHFFEVRKQNRLRVFDILDLMEVMEEPERSTSIGESLVLGMEPLMMPTAPPTFCGAYFHLHYGVSCVDADETMETFAADHGLTDVKKIHVVETLSEMIPYMRDVVLPMLNKAYRV